MRRAIANHILENLKFSEENRTIGNDFHIFGVSILLTHHLYSIYIRILRNPILSRSPGYVSISWRKEVDLNEDRHI